MLARRLLTGGAAAALALAAGAAPAAAHPTLDQAAPTPGLSAPVAPREVQLAFSEPAVARGSRIAVRGPRGPLVAGPLRSGAGGRTLSVALRERLRPGVYDIAWTALGDDGHTTGGRFRFGVAGSGGAPPPGAERLGGTGGVGRGEQTAVAQDGVSVFARWLGIVAAALLAGGGLLAWRFAPARPRWRRLAGPALLVAVAMAVEGVLAAAGAGAAGSLDLGLLTATGAGGAALGRLVVLTLAGLAAARTPRARDIALASGGALALAATAFDGHVATVRAHPVLAVLAQEAHVLAAGVWLGGLLLLALVAERRAAARAFAPLAASALAIAAFTGVLAAIREVHGWYFLRWSDYGRAVLVKAGLVALAALAAAVTTWRLRRGGAGLPRTEALAVVAVAAAASLLAALPQGRGQALPAQRGTLLPGPALASLLTAAGPAPVTLAPALPGVNRLVVALPDGGRDARVRLACACESRPVHVTLRGGAATVRLSTAGQWYAYVEGAASPASLTVGVPRAPGAPPVEVLAAADLSGPDGARCRDLLAGLQLGVGRLNALGGLDGGRKVVLRAYDTGGSAARAAAIVHGRRPLALAGACGTGADAAVRAAGRAGIVSLVGDPAVEPAATAHAFRLAGDSYAEGFAAGTYAREQLRPGAAPGARAIRAVVGGDALGRRWLAGLRAGSRLPVVAARRLGAAAADRRRTLALALDGPAAPLAAALARLGAPRRAFAPAPVLASERTYSERFVTAAGALGRLGVVRGATEVSPDSRDALSYARAAPAIFPGLRPSLEGLRGYVTGLALGAGVRRGTSAAALERALRRPAPFTDALAGPWRADAPAAGGQRFGILGPTFLAATLVPPSAGGESYNGDFFADGAWRRLTSDLYGPSLAAPVPPL